MHLSFPTRLLLLAEAVLGASIKGNSNSNTSSTFYLKATTGTYAGRYLTTLAMPRGVVDVVVGGDPTQKTAVSINTTNTQLMIDGASANYAGEGSETDIFLSGNSMAGGTPVSGFSLSDGTLSVKQVYGNIHGILACTPPAFENDVYLYWSTEDTFPSNCEWMSFQASST